MKIRYPTKCARCGVVMRKGEMAIRKHKTLWHHRCAISYEKYRQVLRGTRTT